MCNDVGMRRTTRDRGYVTAWEFVGFILPEIAEVQLNSCAGKFEKCRRNLNRIAPSGKLRKG